ncbi:hypothetical protein KIF24_16695 [Micromonospora sp. Llam7]|uniref:hypothetical protein n=1 Tax=Micromonospora tarapacensis TaxID=2835305 RepID=UPI001C830BD4|nr:hypothetical protein [Micromonospora tarapacensis]MBX7267504.1 hypothetical protein [Micromonospora tarapacensis]
MRGASRSKFFLDLHGHTPGHEPTSSADALADLLRADGLDPHQLPDGVQAARLSGGTG